MESKLGRDFEESFACKSEAWMMAEYDESVKGHGKISHGNYIGKMIDDKGLEDEVKKLKTMPLHLGVFVLSNSKKLCIILYTQIKDFIHIMFMAEIMIVNIMKINIGRN